MNIILKKTLALLLTMTFAISMMSCNSKTKTSDDTEMITAVVDSFFECQSVKDIRGAAKCVNMEGLDYKKAIGMIQLVPILNKSHGPFFDLMDSLFFDNYKVEILSVTVNDDNTAKVSINISECDISEFQNDLPEMMIKDGKAGVQIERADVESFIQQYAQDYIYAENLEIFFIKVNEEWKIDISESYNEYKDIL